MPVFLDWNASVQPIKQAGLGPARFMKSLGAQDLTWTFVRDAQQNLTAAFVGLGHAILNQFLTMEAANGRLELKPSAFGRVQAGLKLFRGGCHKVPMAEIAAAMDLSVSSSLSVLGRSCIFIHSC